MSPFNRICPHCQHAVTITSDLVSSAQHTLRIANLEGARAFCSFFYVCPNPDCRKFTLTASLHTVANGPHGIEPRETLRTWQLIPDSKAKQFPAIIPTGILEDYEEAYQIKDLSPKASATLSRRCLQGMLRDFWEVKPGKLVHEIDAIQEKVDPLTWKAIDSLRKLGNIGAHMEKDINVIVDVDPEEANLLLGLIETLFNEWYVHREERAKRMNALVAAAESKKGTS